jgi:hypothetical protein
MELRKIVSLGLIAIAVVLTIWYILGKFVEKPPPLEIKPPEKEIPSPVEANEIFIYSDSYEPAHVKIRVGEEVKWINKDDEQHILVCADITRGIPLFDVVLLRGEDFTWSFYSKGSYRFWDPDVGEEKMTGMITVE